MVPSQYSYPSTAKTVEFETKLKEANKMDDVEDAFQAFLDQLDLNENEERIIIDGESRVWKIIRYVHNLLCDIYTLFVSYF